MLPPLCWGREEVWVAAAEAEERCSSAGPGQHVCQWRRRRPRGRPRGEPGERPATCTPRPSNGPPRTTSPPMGGPTHPAVRRAQKRGGAAGVGERGPKAGKSWSPPNQTRKKKKKWGPRPPSAQSPATGRPRQSCTPRHLHHPARRRKEWRRTPSRPHPPAACASGSRVGGGGLQPSPPQPVAPTTAASGCKKKNGV